MNDPLAQENPKCATCWKPCTGIFIYLQTKPERAVYFFPQCDTCKEQYKTIGAIQRRTKLMHRDIETYRQDTSEPNGT